MTRRPYHPPMPRTWWRGRPDHRLYMLREATVLPLLFFVGCLLYGLYALQQSESAWQQWLAFMQRPWVLLMQVLALGATLLHAYTFFRLVPDVIPLRVGGKPLSPWLLIVAQWALLLSGFVGLWWLLRGGGG